MPTYRGESPEQAGGEMLALADSTTSNLYEEFLHAYTRVQLPLHAYIRTLIHDRIEADDVFQETSLVLWRRFPEFSRERDFLRWALGISRRQVLRYWRSKRRDQLVFSPLFLEHLSKEAQAIVAETDCRQELLEFCLQRLTGRQRDLLRQFYGDGLSADSIAEGWKRSVHAVYKSLNVMRRTLFHCVERRLASEI